MNKTKALEEEYVRLIGENEGIIHKVIGLYVDRAEDQKDMYQEILFQAWKSYKNFKGKAKFSTWLYKIALNTALSYRKKHRDFEVLDQEQMMQTDEGRKQTESYEVLYYLIKRLDEIDRMIMTLHMDGYKNHEISEITGMTVNHVNVKIHRLKNSIIEAYKKETNGYL